GQLARWPVGLLDVLQNPLELIQRVIADDELAFAAGGVLDLHFRAELFAQVAFQLADVGILTRRTRRLAFGLREQFLDERFGFADRQLFLRDEGGDLGLLFAIL